MIYPLCNLFFLCSVCGHNALYYILVSALRLFVSLCFMYVCPLVPVECLVSDGKLEAGDLEREDKPRYPVTLSHCLTQCQSLLMQHSEMRNFQNSKVFLGDWKPRTLTFRLKGELLLDVLEVMMSWDARFH